MSGLDWGTVPAWASAIGTSGSLLLGFTILLRDRRRQERQEAQKVVTHLHFQDGHAWVHLLNTADRPISYPHVITGGPEREIEFSVTRLSSGKEATVSVPRYVDGVRNRPLAVRFVDADGYQWIRDLQSNDVLRRDGYRRGHPSLRLLLRRSHWSAFMLYVGRRRDLRR
ncbi:hypothetical protein OG762_05350 [Streptomyces sp. NBC_01136]|uniref:hypothetical protein n=1 Tax=unclassified Streptomyces TaxID=2593676 RepID=UPI00325659F6|nr:hypothetical protein OG762_05350 [Streptomyces sp. NBC_01136]